LEEEVVLNAFQEPPGLPVPFCVFPPTEVGWMKSPMRTVAFEGEASPIYL